MKEVNATNESTIRTLKIRLLPTEDQDKLMWQHVGAARYIWNWALALQQDRYQNGEKHLSGFDLMKLITPLKKEEDHQWLNTVSNATLQTIMRDLDKAYKAFFKGISNKPKFKKRKKSIPRFPVGCDRIYFIDNKAQIQKIGKVRYQTSYDLPQGRGQKFTNPRIKYENDKWILTVGVECENQAPNLTGDTMGVDLGLRYLATVSDQDGFFTLKNINKSSKMKRLEAKRRHIQRNISRKYRTNKSWKKTANILKEEALLKKLTTHMANIRHDYIQKCTHSLVSMLPSKIVMEDLDVSGMIKNKHLAKPIQEASWGEFLRQMAYKCEWNGIEFVQVNRYYASSKTCSSCGEKHPDLKLRDKVFTCPYCGITMDRDENAAFNLRNYFKENDVEVVA